MYALQTRYTKYVFEMKTQSRILGEKKHILLWLYKSD